MSKTGSLKRLMKQINPQVWPLKKKKKKHKSSLSGTVTVSVVIVPFPLHPHSLPSLLPFPLPSPPPPSPSLFLFPPLTLFLSRCLVQVPGAKPLWAEIWEAHEPK